MPRELIGAVSTWSLLVLLTPLKATMWNQPTVNSETLVRLWRVSKHTSWPLRMGWTSGCKPKRQKTYHSGSSIYIIKEVPCESNNHFNQGQHKSKAHQGVFESFLGKMTILRELIFHDILVFFQEWMATWLSLPGERFGWHHFWKLTDVFRWIFEHRGTIVLLEVSRRQHAPTLFEYGRQP